ncbi:hypothetical protein AZE42_12036 [Rhizopogon vesiculosus]|uniref:Uncharacterized protein n=1 Tax=Rhizopogon vesiculosus TaxID=180088 RepID=A0A1J8Q454_9AGAM|nr:hypothetical protein AZE42_12036 [Rhizopogon vesiculosus]
MHRALVVSEILLEIFAHLNPTLHPSESCSGLATEDQVRDSGCPLQLSSEHAKPSMSPQ